MDGNAIEVGRLLQSDVAEFVVNAKSEQAEKLNLGNLVSVNQGKVVIYGIVNNLSFGGGDLLEWMAMADEIPNDSKQSVQNQGVAIRVISVGYRVNGRVFHNLPPRPPLGLEPLILCKEEDILNFTNSAAYLRHIIVRMDEPRMKDMLAAHLSLIQRVQEKAENQLWGMSVIEEICRQQRHNPGIVDLLRAMQGVIAVEESG